MLLRKPSTVAGPALGVAVALRGRAAGAAEPWTLPAPQCLSRNTVELVAVAKGAAALAALQEARREGRLVRETFALVHGRVGQRALLPDGAPDESRDEESGVEGAAAAAGGNCDGSSSAASCPGPGPPALAWLPPPPLLGRDLVPPLSALLGVDRLESADAVAHYRSNSSACGWLTLLRVRWCPVAATMSIKYALLRLGAPVVGRAKNCVVVGSSGTEPSSGHANMIASCGLAFPAIEPGGAPYAVGDGAASADVERMRVLGLKEERFWLSKTAQREVELLALGLEPAAARRAAQGRAPVSHIAGLKLFGSLVLDTGAGVFEPKAASLCLVRSALAELPALLSEDCGGGGSSGGHRLALDLGTGSGCLLLALLNDPSARSLSGLGVDLSQAAVETARRNADRLGLGDRAVFALCDYAQDPLPLPDAVRVSIVLCNPPYLPAPLAAALCADDPMAATDGGKEGLHVYAQVAALCGSAPMLARMAPGALLVLEVPGNRTERHCAVRACFDRHAPQLRYAGYGCDDEAGMKRCLLWRFPPPTPLPPSSSTSPAAAPAAQQQ